MSKMQKGVQFLLTHISIDPQACPVALALAKVALVALKIQELVIKLIVGQIYFSR